MINRIIIIRISEGRKFMQTPSRYGGGSEGKVDERSVVLPLILRTPLNEWRSQVDQLLKQTGSILFKEPTRHNLNQIKYNLWKVCSHYLSCGAGLVAGSDQVRGVGQVDEQLLWRLWSWKVQQENLQREQREVRSAPHRKVFTGRPEPQELRTLMMSLTCESTHYFEHWR